MEQILRGTGCTCCGSVLLSEQYVLYLRLDQDSCVGRDAGAAVCVLLSVLSNSRSPACCALKIALFSAVVHCCAGNPL
jgi:hypothetical protein